ncbi:nudix-type nucleoside diphosphatase, YffH/AdpP family [Faunimonas pinastri]|uniref:GDP-mannose pyrophosphatase n=1 Tax=Faunimonas pinastri TaxID=1855383 RepID=A0A1H9KZY9_9HYPH|nr:NUDIX domain-containing protein [Faunimonas pinastri]SER04485.1 nudix-type nucleoside diphosphatase, YffH/AdpP family [Faunimonas pinastri]
MTVIPPRIVSRELIFKGWNTVEKVVFETTDAHGERRTTDREVVDHGHAAVVLTIDPDRDVAFLVRQWRSGLMSVGDGPFLLEACAGIIDPGEGAEECARREAEEEVGFRLRELKAHGSVVPSAGTLTERMYLYIAEVSSTDRVGKGGGVEDEGEDIEIVEIPIPELFRMARAGAIEDAKTLILVQSMMLERLERAADASA